MADDSIALKFYGTLLLIVGILSLFILISLYVGLLDSANSVIDMLYYGIIGTVTLLTGTILLSVDTVLKKLNSIEQLREKSLVSRKETIPGQELKKIF